MLSLAQLIPSLLFCQTPVLGLGVEFTFALDKNNNNNRNKNPNPHLNFLKGTVLGDKTQGIRDTGLGIRDKGRGIRNKTTVEFDPKDQVLFVFVFVVLFILPSSANCQLQLAEISLFPSFPPPTRPPSRPPGKVLPSQAECCSSAY